MGIVEVLFRLFRWGYFEAEEGTVCDSQKGDKVGGMMRVTTTANTKQALQTFGSILANTNLTHQEIEKSVGNEFDDINNETGYCQAKDKEGADNIWCGWEPFL